MPERLRKAAPHLAVFLLAVTLYSLGLLEFLEFKVADARFKLLHREPKGDLVLIEIDSPSLRELSVWPWPRGYHAAIIEILLAAGVRRIAFDVDFSSHSTPRQDERFARALAKASGRAVLAAFTAKARGGDPAMAVSPLPEFARHALLGSVNVAAENDGQVRRMAVAERWGQGELPTLFARLVPSPRPARHSFYVDFGIEAEGIPRISYAAVLRGRFDPEMLAGRTVLIGATALELGDQIPVPVHGVLPGVVLQALAYESLIQDRALQRLAPWLTMVATLLIVLLLGPRFERGSWRRGAAIASLAVVALFLSSVVVQAGWPVALDIMPWIVAVLASFGLTLFRRIDRQDLRLLAQSLAIRRKDVFMRQVVENTFDGIITFDRNGIVHSFNPAAELIFGCPAQEAVGSDLTRFVGAASSTDAENGAIANGQFDKGRSELTGKRGPDRKPFPLQLATSEMVLDGERCSIAVVRDMSELKRREEGLRAAKQEAEYANRCKTEFLASMSHELRTPLNAIIGFSEIMKNEVLGPVGSVAYRGYAGDIHASGEHLLLLINDILDLSKIDSGADELHEEEIQVATVLRSVLRMACHRAEEAGRDLEVQADDDLPLLLADERKLKQILVNLLTNAIKFSAPGSKVVLKVRCRPDSGFVFQVIDQGIGIAPEDISKALSRFGQVDSDLDRKYEGSGLGLPLSKALVELHGGSFDLESEIDVGTTVTARFPANRIVSAQAGARDHGRDDGRAG